MQNYLDFDLIIADECIERISQYRLSLITLNARYSFGKGLGSLMNFEEVLHLDVRVKSNLDKLLLCVEGLTELIYLWGQASYKKRKLAMDVQYTLYRFKKSLLLLYLQLQMLLYVSSNSGLPNFDAVYNESYKYVQAYVISVSQYHIPINLYVLYDVFGKYREYLYIFLKDITIASKESLEYMSGEEDNSGRREEIERILNRLRVSNSKLMTIAYVFPYACVKDKEDLFSLPYTHPRWRELFTSSITHKIYGYQKKILESFDVIRKNVPITVTQLNIVNAAMSIMHRYNTRKTSNFKSVIYTTSNILKCLLFEDYAHHEAYVMISEPNDQLAKRIWNLPYQEYIRNFIKMSLPTIKDSKELYIPRQLRNFFYRRFREKYYVELPDMRIKHATIYGNELFSKGTYESKVQIRINSSKRLYRKYYTITNEEPVDKNPLKYLNYGFNKILSNVSSFFKEDIPPPQSIIFHIHGGGFISMSSFVHQTYTRVWANALNVPIVSVDYGKAPYYPYPRGLEDCLYAYFWTIECFHQIYNVNPKKIVLVGDSAGGNLVAALTTLLIQFGMRKPDGIVLVYPALNLNIATYTPSFLTALNDMILPHTFLKICLSAYLQDQRCRPSYDPFISPILTPDATLKEYPPTRLFVGNKDPFHDDCCRFVERLNAAKAGNAKMMIFDQFPHGFLQFHTKLAPLEPCRKATEEVQQALQELLSL